MIVRDIMKTELITVEPDDTMSHAANLLRQYQFHHLPVVHKVKVAEPEHAEYKSSRTQLVFEGLLGSQDIELAVALSRQEEDSGDSSKQPWQERRVAEFMHPTTLSVTPTTSVGSAAQLLLERGMSYLPVIEYGEEDSIALPVLVGMITRSDMLLVLARAVGTFEPGMQLDIVLPMGHMTPLAKTLAIADELRIHIRSILAVPLEDGVPRLVTLRLGTMNPAPLLRRLKEEGIQYSFANPFAESEKNYA
jgi:acetoin utilization protein AcuB